ncbi:DUF1479-domain-containing protein [Xylaria intraflava]|nr:DUF1479-domain-containing protein [Xylaria intraflava]
MATDNIMSMLDSTEPIPLASRFAKLKRNMIACREKDVAESFYRLLRALRREAHDIAARGSDVIPTIDYIDIDDSKKVSAFRKALRKRGVAVIKRVVPATVAEAWKEETLDYIADNPQTSGYPPHDPRLFNLYWSPSQVRARADSRLLDAQRFAMGTWHASDEHALVNGDYPVVYADRLDVRTPHDSSLAGDVHVDNGSAERWEPDGYGRSGTYSSVFSGRWEDYDPWDSSPRLNITTDLYNRSGSCSMFRMFQGFLSLSSMPAGSGALTVCPMLQLSTVYLLLRPFFTPRYQDPAAEMVPNDMAKAMGMDKRTDVDYLHPNNWNLNVSQTSILHGAVPGYVQAVNSTLHPHLQLHRTLVSVPDIEPGDYVIWHPDVMHTIGTPFLHQRSSSNSSSSSMSSPRFNLATPSPFSLTLPPSYNPFLPGPSASSPFSHSSSSSSSNSSFGFNRPSRTLHSSSASTPSYTHAHSHSTSSAGSSTTTANISPYLSPTSHKPTTTVLYIPACPLTQTNALYLSRQRRAFLLGLPAPDFSESGRAAAGERDHAGRSNVQDVADAGGGDGLRSMGLTPWKEPRHSSGSDRGSREREKNVRLLRLANEILFPDRYDGVPKMSGRRREIR